MIRVEESIIPKTVMRFEETDNKCKQFWMVFFALPVIFICTYFGFIKNTTKLSHWLGGTGIALEFISTIVLLCVFNHKKASVDQEAIDAQDYERNDGNIDTIEDFSVIVGVDNIEENNSDNQPKR